MHGKVRRSGLMLWACCFFCTLPVLATPLQADSDEFPIIMMSAELGTHDGMRAMGIDFVHTYAYPGEDFLNSAAANGLRVMVNLNGVKWAQEPDGVEQIRNLVRQFRNHPALGFWYLADEPDLAGVTVDDLTRLYTAIKEETPEVLVANAEAWSEHWTAYQGAQDMLMTDHYPVENNDPFPLQDITIPMHFLARALALDDQPVIPILQSFNWQVFRPQTPSRLPVAEELRYWCYASIALGARGLGWYSHYEGLRSPGGAQWFANTFAPVVSEVRQFVDAVAPAHHPTPIAGADAANVYLAIWKRSGTNWVVLVNNLNTGNTVSVSLEGQVADGPLIPWGSTAGSPAAVVGGTLQPVTLAPYEVKVWTQNNSGPLRILSVEAIDITATSAHVHFVFNQHAQGQVEYGRDTGYGNWTTKEESFNYADHTQPLAGLSPATTYHYRVHGWDVAGVEVVSDDYQFTTLGGEPDAGVDADAGADAGADNGVQRPDDGADGAVDAGADGGDGAGSDAESDTEISGDCGCRADTPSPSSLLLMMLAGWMLLVARRRP